MCPWDRTDFHPIGPACVFGIVGKLFENAREWHLSNADILKLFLVIQVSNLEIYIFVRFCLYFSIFLISDAAGQNVQTENFLSRTESSVSLSVHQREAQKG